MPPSPPSASASSVMVTSSSIPLRVCILRELADCTRAISVTSSSTGTSAMGVSSPRLR